MPSSDCPEYVAWKDNKNTQSPWSKIDNMSLSLLRKTLAPLPSNRINIEHIKKHRWMLRVHSSGNYTQFLIFFLSFSLCAPCMKEKASARRRLNELNAPGQVLRDSELNSL
jgi:hypothetical protein